MIQSSVTRERGHGTTDLVEQRPDLRGIIDATIGQRGGHDPAAGRIHADMQGPHERRLLVPCFSSSHSPGPPSFKPVLSTSTCSDPSSE